MYLFKDMNEIELVFNCKVCFKEEKITITKTDFMNISEFPAVKEFIHENPPHKLLLYINKNLEIENFKIEDIIDKDVSYSEDLVKQALAEIELTDEEINLYFLSTGRDVLSLGEISILLEKPKEECQKIAEKFVEKGLFKEVVGASPHYAPLPPYAALVSQLKSFHGFISEIHSNAPKELEASFKELESQTEGMTRLKDYSDFMKDLKSNTINTMVQQKQEMDDTLAGMERIKDLSSTITGLDDKTKALFDQQTNVLTEQFNVINTKVSEAIKKQFLELIEEILGVKTKISTNLQKLRLGVVQQTVDQVIDNIFSTWITQMEDSLNQQVKDIEKVTEEVLKGSIQGFFNDFISNLKDIIENSVQNIDNLLETTSKAGGELKILFEDVNQKFSRAVEMSEEKIDGITDSISASFGTLQDTFSNQIIRTLEQVLGDILNRLEISETTTKEFWDQAKKTSTFTMKDIWFIRSVEGAKAHINEVVKKVKSKILIVAPEITDVDIDSLKGLKKHINIRIACSIDLSKPDHVSAYHEITEIPNATVRHRALQNIWGINRDYEEVILCVISKTLVGSKMETEIAGIGSQILEHIKIFVPNLEDAWLNAHKEVLSAMPSAINRDIVRQRLIEKQDVLKSSTAPPHTQRPAPAPKITQSPQFVASNEPIHTPQPTSASPPKDAPLQMPDQLNAAQKPITDPQSEPSSQSEPMSHLAPVSPKPSGSSALFQDLSLANLTGEARLTQMFDLIVKNIGSLTGSEASSSLSQLHGEINDILGYSAILKQIELGINSIRSQGKMSKSESDSLIKKIKFWRKKLKL